MVLVIGLMLAVLVVTAGAAPVSVERTEGPLALEASLGARTVASGAAVRMTLVVRNTGPAPVGLMFTSGQRAEFIVRRPRGDEVWRWSHDKAFTQAIQTLPLRPQEPLTIAETWDQRDLQGRPVDPGAYEVIAVFLGRLGDGRAIPPLPPLPVLITR